MKSANLLLFSSSSLSWTGSISKIWSQSGGSTSPNGWATWLFAYTAGYIRKVQWVAKEFNMKIFYKCKPGTNPFLDLLLNFSKHKKIASSSWSFCYPTPQKRAILHWLTGPPNYAPHYLLLTQYHTPCTLGHYPPNSPKVATFSGDWHKSFPLFIVSFNCCQTQFVLCKVTKAHSTQARIWDFEFAHDVFFAIPKKESYLFCGKCHTKYLYDCTNNKGTFSKTEYENCSLCIEEFSNKQGFP